MLRFPEFEQHGVRLAAISGAEDGDCGYRAEDPADQNSYFARCGVARASVVGVKQVHGTTILIADDRHAGQGVWDDSETRAADGIVTNLPGLTLSIAVADCVPVFLYAPDVPAIGLLHAGREGTRNGIAEQGVHLLASVYGALPARMFALIGPSICGKCYEVAPEMVEAFRTMGYNVSGQHLDLWNINRRQLEAAGIDPQNIHTADICTLEDPRFHSFRENATRKRNLALIGL